MPFGTSFLFVRQEKQNLPHLDDVRIKITHVSSWPITGSLYIVDFTNTQTPSVPRKDGISRQVGDSWGYAYSPRQRREAAQQKQTLLHNFLQHPWLVSSKTASFHNIMCWTTYNTLHCSENRNSVCEDHRSTEFPWILWWTFSWSWLGLGRAVLWGARLIHHQSSTSVPVQDLEKGLYSPLGGRLE